MSHTPSHPWDAFVENHPQAHLLQTTGWGALKSEFGWWQRLVTLEEGGRTVAGALILLRRVPSARLGLPLAYVPKGPLVDWQQPDQVHALLARIRDVARQEGAILLKIEPDLPDSAENRAMLAHYGFRPSPQTVQPRSTVTVDLRPDAETILAGMKSKWRYNIRLAQRKGVTVRSGTADDLDHFQALMEETGARDNFDVHSMAYYRRAFELLTPQHGHFFFAEYQGEPLASIVVLRSGGTAWYLWGASGNRHRNLMPNHALQWAAMTWAKANGATRYDLWGIPDEIGQVALGMAAALGHPVLADDLPVDINRFPEGDLWGVFRFKQGFGGHVERFVGAWDLPLSAIGYAAYRGAWGVKAMAQLRNGGMAELRNCERTPTPHAPQSPIPNPQSPISNIQYPIPTPGEWRSTLAVLPNPHVLQSWEWGELKGQTGWRAHRFGLKDGSGRVRAAWQLLIRRPVPGLPVGIGYVPKGPTLDWNDDGLAAEVLARIEAQSRRMGCLFVKIDPDVAEESQAGRRLLALLRQRGWRFSRQQIQFKNTAFTDLRPDPDGLLADMKSKWRYNIRLAERRGITVRQGGPEDVAVFYRLYAQTGERDGFLVRPEGYYDEVCRTLLHAQADPANPLGGALLLAEHPEESEPLAGLFLFRYGERCWYFYGASSDLRRRDMPNYLLQWAALQWAREQGCTLYDWWGAPTRLDDPDDSMQGVWRFKEGFNAQFQNHIGAWDWGLPLA